MGIAFFPRRSRTAPPAGTGLNGGDPLADGLLDVYVGNEGGGGTAYDLVRPSFKGALSSGVTFTQKPPLGHVWSFDGSTNAAITLPVSLFPSSVLSVSAWFLVGDVSTYRPIFSIRNSADTDAIELFSTPSGDPHPSTFWFGGYSAGAYAPNNSLTVNTWYHVVGTSDGTSLTLYLNGISKATGTTAFSTFNINSYIGARQATSFNHSGQIGMVAIWKRALSAAEVQRLYLEPYALLQPMVSIAKRVQPSVSAGGGFLAAWASKNVLIGGGAYVS